MNEPTLDSCGCCEGPGALTPASVKNVPGLDALAYRVGTHGRFNQAMQLALSRPAVLRALTTRDPNDPALALLDAWATVLDVLAFYQERIANEAFLRTATERRSLLELSRAIGYELGPGVAASTFLAFSMDDVAGSPQSVQLAIGTKAQSVPKQDEKPQIFETIEAIEARPAWNALRPQRFQSQLPLRSGDRKVYLQGTATQLKPGDALLVIGDERVKDAKNENWDFRRVKAIETVSLPPTEGANAGYTVVTLDRGLGTFMPPMGPAQKNPKVYALRQRAAIFGYNAVEWKSLPSITKAAYLGIAETALTEAQKVEWPDFTIFSPDSVQSAAAPVIEKHVPPTVQEVAAAAMNTSQAIATLAASEATQAGFALVSAGAEIGQKSAKLAEATVKGLNEVALTSARAVQNSVMQTIESQMSVVNGLLQLPNGSAAIEAAIKSALTEVGSAADEINAAVAGLSDPRAIVSAVIEVVKSKLDEKRNKVVDGILKHALGIAHAKVSAVDDDQGFLDTVVGLLTGEIVARTVSKATSAITGSLQEIVSTLPGYVQPGGNILDATNDVFKDFLDSLGTINVAGANPIQALLQFLKQPAQIMNHATAGAASIAKSAVGFAYGSLAQTHASLTSAADIISQAAVSAVQVINPDNLVSEVRNAAELLRDRAEKATIAGGSAAGGAAAAALVSAAVKIAVDAPAPLPKPTPQSVSDVANLFADAAVALLQAAEGVTPPAVQAALDSPVGQSMGQAFEAARQAMAAARSFVAISDAPVNGARRVAENVKSSIVQAMRGRKENVPFGYAAVQHTTDTIDLDAAYPKIVSGGGWLVLSTPEYQEVFKIVSAAESARAEFGLSGKTTRVKLAGENYDKFRHAVRTTVAYGESELLEWAEEPITTPVELGEILVSPAVEGLAAGRYLSVSGTPVDATDSVSEVVQIQSVHAVSGMTRIVLKSNLAQRYERDSVTLDANVARATHGETATEILGTGDGSQAFQRFKLKRAPLTFVSAPTPSGGASTLEIRVKGVRWEEQPSFYEVAPSERAFVTRRAEDATSLVQFGDGASGARLPTGTNNVVATYRAGLGLAGNVATGQISQLLSRPLGLKGVINPTPAIGGDDPETLDDARRNAPLTVLTLERIVSLRDFEDFARAFSGIGKARATLLWSGERQLVHLTVAAANGGRVEPSSALYKNLLSAIDAARHPDQPVRVSPHVARTFALNARVATDPTLVRADVLTELSAKLVAAFSFGQRDFARGVTASEVLATMQAVPGVVAIDLETLAGKSPIKHPNVPAQSARLSGSTVTGAELLLIDANGITLTDLPL